MTHDELLAKINENMYEIARKRRNNFKTHAALRAVVELHPVEEVGNSWVDEQSGRYGVTIYMCTKCNVPYPCEDIQAIEKELK